MAPRYQRLRAHLYMHRHIDTHFWSLSRPLVLVAPLPPPGHSSLLLRPLHSPSVPKAKAGGTLSPGCRAPSEHILRATGSSLLSSFHSMKPLNPGRTVCGTLGVPTVGSSCSFQPRLPPPPRLPEGRFRSKGCGHREDQRRSFHSPKRTS